MPHLDESEDHPHVSDPAYIRERIAHLNAVADLMDSQFSFFGFRFGLDAIIGLVPAVGDVIAGLVSLYIIWQARVMGVPEVVLRTMIVRTAIDVVVGGIPVVGDLVDALYRVNRRNVALIERYYRDTGVL